MRLRADALGDADHFLDPVVAALDRQPDEDAVNWVRAQQVLERIDAPEIAVASRVITNVLIVDAADYLINTRFVD